MSTTLVHIDWQNPPYKVFHGWFILEYSHIYMYSFFSSNVQNSLQEISIQNKTSGIDVGMEI